MQDLKPIIAKNITALRQEKKMTQIELAEQLNYSDKAVSKWERGESVPDVMVLKALADLFGVTVDYLLEEEHPVAQDPLEERVLFSAFRNHTVVTLLGILVVWFAATLCFVVMDLIAPGLRWHWLSFVYAVPACMIVWLVFNSLWFNRRRNYMIISFLMWSALLAAVLTTMAFDFRAWQMLTLGVPGQAAICIWSRFITRKKESDPA